MERTTKVVAAFESTEAMVELRERLCIIATDLHDSFGWTDDLLRFVALQQEGEECWLELSQVKGIATLLPQLAERVDAKREEFLLYRQIASQRVAPASEDEANNAARQPSSTWDARAERADNLRQRIELAAQDMLVLQHVVESDERALRVGRAACAAADFTGGATA